MYAPVCLSTYARYGHLARTMDALRKNVDADKHELFVFSDGPRPGDEAKVAAVRKYLRSINGFKNITIFERTENDRVRNNRGGMKNILDHYGRIIFLEEDVVSSPGFLRFVNNALHRYENESKVFSITGWCPRFKTNPGLSEGSSFFIPRFAGWGFGIWRDRFEKISQIGPEGLHDIETNREALQRLENQMGSEVLKMIRADAKGLINALDVRACFHQALTGELTLYPYPSLTANIGLDGTGEHCGFMFGLNMRLTENALLYQAPNEIAVNTELASLYIDALHVSPYMKILNRIAGKFFRSLS